MDSLKKPSFVELVKSEIQDLDESLSSIPNLWGEDPVPLTETFWFFMEDGRTSLKFIERYNISPSIKKKIGELFTSDQWS